MFIVNGNSQVLVLTIFLLDKFEKGGPLIIDGGDGDADVQVGISSFGATGTSSL